MSVRIYQLSKELELSNKEVITLLQARGLDVSSPSNTIPNIYADSILAEFKKTGGTLTKEPETATKQPEKKEVKATTPPPPTNRFVKTADDIVKEKEAAKEAATEKKEDLTPVTTPAPEESAPPAAALTPPPRRPGAAPSLPPRGSAPRTPPALGSPATQATGTPRASNAPVLPNFKPKTEEKPTITEPAKVVPAKEKLTPEGLRILHCKPPIVVRELAQLIDIKPFKLISELMEMGIFASMNQTIEEEIAVKLAQKHGCLLEVHHRGEQQQQQQEKKKEAEAPKVDESKFMEPRPPVVCVLGHVDHGKTTLLDTIRKANVVAGEAGGITQHVGAYQVEHNGHRITFIDTPGHAAFSKMRERGANVTDIAILVIAADDAFKPQTIEALKFAQKANVPVVVAINKMDARGANLDRVMQQMQEHNISPEDWGGETLCTPVSALKGENIDKLLELVLLQAEMLELKANPKCPAEGIIIESQIEIGRGPTATVIIGKGTLKTGDALVCGDTYCKVRAMMNDAGEKINSVGPGSPALVMGWAEAPESGSAFQVVKNDREAKKLAAESEIISRKDAQNEVSAQTPTDLKDLFAAIEQQQQKTLKVIIKGDVHGTVEALAACLEDIKSDKVALEIISKEVGPISKGDILTADASKAALIAFNVKCEGGVQAIAKHHDVRIIQHNIIYELIDQVKECMEELLDPELKENKLGGAEVRQVFMVTKKAIAGCMVTEGKITRDNFARVLRGKKQDVMHQGKISTLKRFKDDATEVRAGYECGIQVSGFNDYKEGDIIECFEIIKVKPKL